MDRWNQRSNCCEKREITAKQWSGGRLGRTFCLQRPDEDTVAEIKWTTGMERQRGWGDWSLCIEGKVTNWVEEVGLRLEEGFFELALSCFRKPTRRNLGAVEKS